MQIETLDQPLRSPTRTIVQAIVATLRTIGRPLTHGEIYRGIVERKLYEFHSENPISIVRSQLRRHCIGLDFPSSSNSKHFRIEDGNKYWLSALHVQLNPGGSHVSDDGEEGQRETSEQGVQLASRPSSFDVVRRSLEVYIDVFRKDLLCNLKALEPFEFEVFSKNLLDSYGFTSAEVTRYSKDGGIDGYGNLKIGLGTFKVAFQCKRYRRSKVQRQEIDAFRGAIQGRASQGIFFTTSEFTPTAIADAQRGGAVPIVLVDGNGIVDLMIKNRFGVQIEDLEVPINAIDLVIGEDATRTKRPSKRKLLIRAL